MRKIDYVLQRIRFKQVEKFIIGNSILDIGCHLGELFIHLLKKRPISGEGIDTILCSPVYHENYTLYPGYFPADHTTGRMYDNITLLAVLEHIPLKQIEAFPDLLNARLHPEGRIIITMPSRLVDYILPALQFLKLIDGMDVEHHQPFNRASVRQLFLDNGFKLIREKRFEFGLNRLYVFQKNI